MKLLLLTIACLMGVAYGRPKYIAIPVDDIQFLSFAPIPVQREGLVRVPRQVQRYAPPPPLQYVNDAEAEASEGRHARQAHHHHDHHDYVDYGAHTGHHGAFGWYADYPVHADEH